MTAARPAALPETPVPPAETGSRLTGRESARAFVDRHLVTRADHFDRVQRVSPDLLAEAAEAGLWSMLVPAEFGGLGLGMAALGEVTEEVGRACSSVRNLLTVHSMVSWAVDRWGSPEQRARWLPELADGNLFGVFCLTEPGGGSALARVGSTAVRDGDEWVIDGRKSWITGGQLAGLLLVFARTEDGVLPFLVPRSTPGVTITPVTGMLGSRASMLGDVTLSDARVGPDALLGPQRFAAGAVMTHTLDIGRYTVAWGCVGMLQGCLDECVRHARRPLPAGGTLGEHQLVQAKIADMATSLRAARLLCEHAGRTKDAGDAGTLIDTWEAKYFASRAAAAAASDAVQILGAEGCAEGSVVARHYRDAKIMEIIEGSNEIQQLTIAGHVLREGAR